MDPDRDTRVGTAAEEEFLRYVARTLAALDGVEAVALGGSRAQGTHRPGSDWDLAVYYRTGFRPEQLRGVGWDGEVSEIGGWGGGVFNGGAWLRIGGRSVDVHYRDLGTVHRELGRARRGEFSIEPLMFHLAGIPTYLVVGELAINRVLYGRLPVPAYPGPLRAAAPQVWAGRARLTLSYAERHYAPAGQITLCAGMLAVAAVEYSHAVLAGRGEWTTNEKRLLERAGLQGLDTAAAGLGSAGPGHGLPRALAAGLAEVRKTGEALLLGSGSGTAPA